MNLMIAKGKHQHDDNKYEINAENLEKELEKWYNKFKKD